MAFDGIDQLQQIAKTTPPVNRGRGQGQRGRGHSYGMSQGHPQGPTPYHTDYMEHHHNHPPPSQAWNAPSQAPLADLNAFPPLSSNQQQQGRRHQQQTYNSPQTMQQQSYPHDSIANRDQSQHFQRRPPQYQQGQYFQQAQPYQELHYNQQQVQSPARGWSDSSRGRGSRGGYQQQRYNNQYQTHFNNNQPLANTNEFARPPAHPNQRLYAPNANPHYGTSDQQKAFRHKIMTQSDFLASLASQNLRNQMTQEELQAKEAFRKMLQDLAHKAIACDSPESVDFNVEEVKLRLYGSLGSGFAVAGSDMDLLLAFPKHEESSGDIEIKSRRTLEKALLDAGYGARLLTNTRVPILKVCEKPSPELLDNLRAYRIEWERSEDQEDTHSSADRGNESLPSLTSAQTETATEALSLLDLDAVDIPLPESPALEHAKLDFTDACGIQCDINFSNYVALHNTELLKAYGRADSRVRQMGIFVKNWAKARDINTPYRGTLSSYGYILMVLHYLINIVKPPVIPNLQQSKKRQDEWQNVQDVLLVEGFDVRFVRNPDEVQELIQKMPKNHESLGSLLRGFFWYYSVPQGFHWGQEVISIRTEGGRVTKRSKGWTEAKWANQSSNIRLRYLLAIEDPFETEHNVGRTVGHSGIVAIRDEFRRAWSIIDGVQYDAPAKTYFWVKPDTGAKQNAEEFMAISTDRGDLLRKDQTFHRDKMRRMRQEAETKEQALRAVALEEAESNVLTDGTQKNGMWTDENSEYPPGVDPMSHSDWSNQELIHHRSYQEKNREWKEPRNQLSRRRVQDEGDGDDNDDNKVEGGEVSENRSNQDQVQPDDHCQKDGLEHKNISENEQASTEPSNKQASKERSINPKQGRVKRTKRPNFARDRTVQTHLDAHSHAPAPDKKVGRNSYWDRDTCAGRWLCWRDNIARSTETFEPVNPVYKNLNEKFPFNPEISFADLAVLNSELRKYYFYTMWPVGAPAQQDLVKTSSNESDLNNVAKVNEDSCTSKPEVIQLAEEKPPADTEYQAPRPGSHHSDGLERSTGSSIMNLQELREKRTIYYSRNVSQGAPEKTSKLRRDSAVSFIQNSGSDVDKNNSNKLQTESKAETQLPAEQRSPTLLNHQQNLLSLLNVRAAPAVEQLVPLTLYPNVPSDQRPRDEDPAIMPIPRKLGFQFDPRQLETLDIIRNGGNGCAKRGEEFSIEEDYEFGGGGKMAYKSSSGARGISDNGFQLSGRSDHGDKVALLDKIPGSG